MVEGGDFLVPNKKVEHCLNAAGFPAASLKKLGKN